MFTQTLVLMNESGEICHSFNLEDFDLSRPSGREEFCEAISSASDAYQEEDILDKEED